MTFSFPHSSASVVVRKALEIALVNKFPPEFIAIVMMNIENLYVIKAPIMTSENPILVAIWMLASLDEVYPDMINHHIVDVVYAVMFSNSSDESKTLFASARQTKEDATTALERVHESKKQFILASEKKRGIERDADCPIYNMLSQHIIACAHSEINHMISMIDCYQFTIREASKIINESHLSDKSLMRSLVSRILIFTEDFHNKLLIRRSMMELYYN